MSDLIGGEDLRTIVMRKKLRQAGKNLNYFLEDRMVGALSRRWKTIDETSLAAHKTFIKKNYIHPPWYWETEGGRIALEELAIERLQFDRRTYIPWLSSLIKLDGSRVLELGSGTGSSTVALAEQGAKVTGLDILADGIKIAKEKCRLFGVESELMVINGVEYMKNCDASFDAVIFFATLEHMLPDERMEALRGAWRVTRPGGYIIIIEAPNRLWYEDGHTSKLPFFNWLPAELALNYMQFSPRKELVELLASPPNNNVVELYRWGLGVSFHEIDLALGIEARRAATKSMRAFLRRRNPIRYAWWHISGERKYSRFLKRAAADVEWCWLEPGIDVAIPRR